MEIITIESFLSYYEKTRQATNNVIEVIPPGKINWAYMPGKFTIGDQVRHIAGIERYVFAEIAIGNRPKYKGCGKDVADGFEHTMSYFHTMHHESVNIFRSIPNESLKEKIKSLDGREVELSNFLRALIVHEVHHRAALCIYLNLLGVETPAIMGLKEEQVIQFSK